ncbi:MAG: hypothetical protein ABI600_21280 [Luteolibacter sp.]
MNAIESENADRQELRKMFVEIIDAATSPEPEKPPEPQKLSLA